MACGQTSYVVLGWSLVCLFGIDKDYRFLLKYLNDGVAEGEMDLISS